MVSMGLEWSSPIRHKSRMVKDLCSKTLFSPRAGVSFDSPRLQLVCAPLAGYGQPDPNVYRLRTLHREKGNPMKAYPCRSSIPQSPSKWLGVEVLMALAR